MKHSLFKTALITLCLATGATEAQANLLSFNIDYSGVSFGNTAEAHGIITIDDQLLPNPGSNFLSLGAGQAITALTLTVSNASSGNGTFQTSDFDFVSWDSAGETLDLSQQLIGQWTTGGAWGTGGAWNNTTGEFNFYATAGSFAPTSYGHFTLATNNDVFGGGDLIKLTSIRPVPVPGAIWLFGSSICGFLALRRKQNP